MYTIASNPVVHSPDQARPGRRVSEHTLTGGDDIATRVGLHSPEQKTKTQKGRLFPAVWSRSGDAWPGVAAEPSEPHGWDAVAPVTLSVGPVLRSMGRTLTERECTAQRPLLQAVVVCPLRSVWLVGCNHNLRERRFFLSFLERRGIGLLRGDDARAVRPRQRLLQMLRRGCAAA